MPRNLDATNPMNKHSDTFDDIATFLEGITRNNNALRRAIDNFVDKLKELEHVSPTLKRTTQIAEFHNAIERYQATSIVANQSLIVAGCIAKSIRDTSEETTDRTDTPPDGRSPGDAIE